MMSSILVLVIVYDDVDAMFSYCDIMRWWYLIQFLLYYGFIYVLLIYFDVGTLSSNILLSDKVTQALPIFLSPSSLWLKFSVC